jgi:ActR/RegA family two-component response regulator/AraC-like DNA-binding protein
MAAEPCSRAGDTGQDPCGALPRARIVWIDDEINESSPEIRALRLDGFDVHFAVTAAQGISLARHVPYDLMLLDLRLPDSDGLEVLEQLVGFDAPVVVLTGYGDVQNTVRAFKLGVSDFLCKPIDVDSLSSLIARLVSGRQVDASDWLRIESERLRLCRSQRELIHFSVRLLLDRRLTLRWVPGGAAALRLALRTPPLASVSEWTQNTARDMAATLREALDEPWPTDRRLVEGLTRIGLHGRKESQQLVARRLRLSRAHLSRRIKHHTGRPPSQWVTFAAGLAAFRDVIESTEAISQIAYAHGWQHHSQFDDDFLRLFGSSPSAVRHLMAQRWPGLQISAEHVI